MSRPITIYYVYVHDLVTEKYLLRLFYCLRTRQHVGLALIGEYKKDNMANGIIHTSILPEGLMLIRET